jgi:hypothetical protein
MKYCHFYTYTVADILLYPKSADSAQTVEFSRRTSSESATRHKNMISAHRNMFYVLCEIGRGDLEDVFCASDNFLLDFFKGRMGLKCNVNKRIIFYEFYTCAMIMRTYYIMF